MSDSDLAVYERQKFGQPLGFGVAPALVVIDFIKGFADPDIMGGGNIAEAIAHTEVLLAAARKAGIPIAFARHVYADDGSNFGLFNLKHPANNMFTRSSPLVAFVPSVAPLEGELVVDKQYPSVFSGTTFATWLAVQRVDTLILAGCTTSGCVRAGALDAMCAGFRPIVVRECAGDRALGPHEASLFDLEQKYADVIPLERALAHLAKIGS